MAILTQLVFSWIVGELNDEQVFTLHTAPYAVRARDVRTLGRSPLQNVPHLGVGVIGKLDDGGRLISKVGKGNILPC